MITYGKNEHGAEVVSGNYASVDEFIDFLNGPPVNPKSQPGVDGWRSDSQTAWMGLSGFCRRGEKSVAATQRAIREGWSAGAEMVTGISQAMESPVISSIRRRAVWCEQGDEIEMQRVWSGSLDTAWRRTKRQPSRGPTRVRIVIDAIAHAGVGAQTMALRGAAAIRLCDAATAAGYSVEVVSAWTGARDAVFELSVVTKRFDMPVDISSLAATTALPAFFRALGHLWGPMATKDVGHYGGYIVDDLRIDPFLEDGVMTFLAPQSLDTTDACVDWLAGCVAELNGGLLLAA